jgi:hypothetical protein
MSRLKAIAYNVPKVYVCALAHKAIQLYGGLLEISSSVKTESGCAPHPQGTLIEISFMKANSTNRLKHAVNELKKEWNRREELAEPARE